MYVCTAWTALFPASFNQLYLGLLKLPLQTEIPDNGKTLVGITTKTMPTWR